MGKKGDMEGDMKRDMQKDMKGEMEGNRNILFRGGSNFRQHGEADMEGVIKWTRRGIWRGT